MTNKKAEELEIEIAQLRGKLNFLQYFNDGSATFDVFRDRNGNLKYYSGNAEAITGYSRQDFVEGVIDLFSLFHPHDFRSLDKVFLEMEESPETREVILRMKVRSGSIRSVHVSISPVHDDSKLIGYRLEIADITDLKHYEDDPEDIRIRLQTILDNCNDGIILINDRGIIIEWSKAVEKTTGLARERAINNYVWDIQANFIPDQQKETITTDFLKHAWNKEVLELNEDESINGFGEILSKTGLQEFIEDLVKPVVAGNRKYFCVVQHYVTKEKNAEQLLSESEERLRRIIDLSPVPMLRIRKKDMFCLDANKSFEQLTGYLKEDVIGRNHLQFDFSPDLEQHQRILRDLSNGADKVTVPLKIKTRMGAGLDLLCSISEIIMIKEAYYIAVLYDITELKEAEAKLQKKMTELATVNARLEQYVFANEELKQFAYISSHQLQEPIRTVSNYMNVIEEDYSAQLDSTAMRYIRIVKEATRRMTGLINTLLEYSRIGRDKKLVRVSCRELAENTVLDLDYLVKSTDAFIRIGDLPELDLYAVEFRQLLRNLLINAIKFREKNVKPLITISSERLDGKWKFLVKDNGIGIDPSYSEKIFEIFQRLHMNEDEYEGKGVGLAFCKKIVQLHSGEIWFESAHEGGTVFCFTIPDNIPS